MDKSLASSIMDSILELDKAFENIENFLREIPDEIERAAALRVLGNVILDLNEGLIQPIVGRFPDLDPEEPNASDTDQL